MLRSTPMVYFEMHVNEKLIGFDARKAGASSRALWEIDRQETYLLKKDSARILSTDSMVWPSIFDDLEDWTSSDRWIGANDPCWANLHELSDFCKGKSIRPPYCLIAITCVADNDQHDWQSAFPFAAQTKPEEVAADWSFLGFDVSDGMLSGLSNCGYDKSDFAATEKADWARRLNDNHLFSNLADAEKFRIFTDSRVSEHAPFLVYGLYLIDEIGG